MVATLDLSLDAVALTAAVCDIESVSLGEAALADAIEAALAPLSHLHLTRIGNSLVARTELGRAERVLIAGHIDTVPLTSEPANLPTTLVDGPGGAILRGRGTVDMKGGVAVMLRIAALVPEPNRDLTLVFYEAEEIDSQFNGLGLIEAAHPELITDAAFAVLMEPTDAAIEGGCKGTLRAEVTTKGIAAHSARPWKGHNAIHDAAGILDRLAAYEPRNVVVDGLEYREGLNAVRIAGGIAGNVIPDRCTIEINFRFAPDRTLTEAQAFVTDVFAGYDVEFTDLAPAARPGLDLPAAREFVDAVGGEPGPKYGWTDVARFAELGVPAVNFGPGDPGKAHADDEFCPVIDLHTCHDALLRWLG